MRSIVIGSGFGGIAAALRLKAKKHDVILFHVSDKKKEIELTFDNKPYVFVDLETGEELKLNPSQVKEKYKEITKSQREMVKLKCGQFAIDYVDVDIQDGVHKVLQQYLIKRNKLVK